jgi:hypothetical protein
LLRETRIAFGYHASRDRDDQQRKDNERTPSYQRHGRENALERDGGSKQLAGKCHVPTSLAELSYVARQGMQLGRDGRVAVRIHQDAIQIGGHAVTCVDGTLEC